MSKEVVAEVIALIELGMIAPEDIVKCLRKANSEPPQRTWVGLTDDEINTTWKKWIGTERANKSYTLAIENALRSKNT